MRCNAAAVCAVLLTACASWTPEQRANFANAMAGTAQASQPAQRSMGKLMVFGGADHKTYLGCLNCGQYASDSVENTYGSFGSAYSTVSISNQFGEFGSPYSQYSACNPYSSDPPVVVDSAGNFYGRLTVNAYNPQRIRDESVVQWLADKVCSH
jgi:hypothetical protein